MQLTWTGFVDWLWRAAAILGVGIPAAALIAKMLVQHRFDRLLKEHQHRLDRELKDREADRKRELDDMQRAHADSIERLRGELKDRQDLLSAAISAGAATQLASQQHRIGAIEKFWSGFLDVKESTYWSIIGFQSNIRFAVNTAERLERSRMFRRAEEGGGWTAVHSKIHEVGRGADRLRPLLGEPLYGLQWVYTAVLSPAIMCAEPEVSSLARPGVGSDTCSHGWHELREDDLRAYLAWVQGVLPTFDVEYAVSLGDQLLRYVLDVLEGAIVREMQFLLSGATASQERVEQFRRLAETVPVPGTWVPGT